MNRPILITGAGGQIGDNLVQRFISLGRTVIATDIRKTSYSGAKNIQLNVLDKEAIVKLVKQECVGEIYHLAAILSATGEKNPLNAWQLNMDSLLHILEVAKEYQCKVFWPSSIAIFGETSPKENTPQTTITEPSTAYGISKVAGELWCNYYFKHFGVDVRSLRFPGLISATGEPGGGTTDYAVHIYHHAVKQTSYTCFLNKDTCLPMMYIDDAMDAILQIMEAKPENITARTSYNIQGMSFTPAEIAQSIQAIYPDFNVEYEPDSRQAIADAWPNSLNDALAREDWDWNPKYNLEKMTKTMIRQLEQNG